MAAVSDYVEKMIQIIDNDTWIGPDSIFYGTGPDWFQHWYQPESYGVPRSSIPSRPIINNLDSLLHDIYLRYVAINDEDFEYYYNVVQNIFLQMHAMMKKVDRYYERYSSNIQFVGSHPDKLRINKPDEFDIDIVMKLPVSFKTHPKDPSQSDFHLEPSSPGFMNLKMGKQYQCLPKRDRSDWSINRRAYQWKDDENYLLRSKFLDWFKSVVSRALNEFVETPFSRPVFYVDGVPYTVRRSESGPAMTMYVENEEKLFKLDVDLVLGLRFPIDRWSESGYSDVPRVCLQKNYWMLVPKLNKSGSPLDRNRSWRVAMHEQERMLMHNTVHMKQAIRFMKKFRDAQNMNKLASYYIKTLFFWEVARREHDRTFWNNSPAFLFRYMLQNLYTMLRAGNIPYFWDPCNNLIGDVDRATLNRYANIIRKLINILNAPSNYKEVAKFMLTKDEYKEYKEILHVTFCDRLSKLLCKIVKVIFGTISLFILLCIFFNSLD